MCRVDFFDHETFQSLLSNKVAVTSLSSVFLSIIASLIPCCSWKYSQLKKKDSVTKYMIGMLTTRSKIPCILWHVTQGFRIGQPWRNSNGWLMRTRHWTVDIVQTGEKFLADWESIVFQGGPCFVALAVLLTNRIMRWVWGKIFQLSPRCASRYYGLLAPHSLIGLASVSQTHSAFT